jgi:monoamine oxidase
VIALPLGVLQQGAVRFDPPLEAKKAALRGLAAGPVIKLMLQFRRAFWSELDEGRYRDATFFHLSHQHLFPTFWTQAPARTPLLCAWAGGPRAAKLSAEFDREAMIRQAIADLTVVFNGRVNVAAELQQSWLHDWQRDPFARGAYSYVVAGGGDARARLAEPLLQTLFFAGEATDDEEAATVAGALRSGERAAREIIG